MKNKTNRISNWVAIITVGLVLVSHIWTISFTFGSFKEQLNATDKKIEDLTVVVKDLIKTVNGMKETMDKSFPLVDHRVAETERRLDKLEPKVSALEKKLQP
ncbi:MAG TPA: hypothetical protein VFE50_21125 [Cyclobacteriaceae bacterium]|nr:hypothetical protein [Cyclobacteriaceae bacterium]